MKKTLLLTGSIATVAIPFATAVSCSSSWIKWNKNESQDPKTQVPSYDNQGTHKEVIPVGSTGTKATLQSDQYQIRKLDVIKGSWFDPATNVIDLDQIHNQFELNILLIDILKLKTPQNIELYWPRLASNSNLPQTQPPKSSPWVNFSTDYISKINDSETIKFTFHNQEKDVVWDIKDIKAKLLTDLADVKNDGTNSKVPDFEKNMQTNVDNTNPSSPKITTSGLTVATDSALNLMSIPLVNSLYNIDQDYTSFKLSLLVNLPASVFDDVASLLQKLSDFTDSIYSVNSRNKFLDPVINVWARNKSVDGNLKIKEIELRKERAEGLAQSSFLLQALTTDYDLLIGKV